MKQRGRSTNQALLRTVVNKKYQTYSHKRLLIDLEEIEKEKIPLCGVTARPLDTNMFIWHANLKGPEGTHYEGGVFHLQIKLPLSYPHHPPTINIYTSIPHPNVFGNFICLDMIKQNGSREEGQGWSSAYSILSILTQLQSFLFEENLTENKETFELNTKKAVKDANSFKCKQCKHGGKLSCWPPFSLKENIKDEFLMIESENQIIRKELICYHTKLSYKESQLGLGLRISKIPRTGNIRQAQTFYDYISIKAFLKQSVNRTSYNERITHWIPVYFGKEDNQQKFFKFLTKSLSMIMTNSTRNFKKEHILEVLPKLMITIIYYIMDQKKHASIRNIRLLIHIHSILLGCIQKYSELKDHIKKTLTKFIQCEQERIKDVHPNLGCVLAILSVSDSHKFSDIVEAYFFEQLDRQVLWILKAVPELAQQNLEKDVENQRDQIVFKSQITSFQMLCFYHLFIHQICQKRKNRSTMLEQYKNNLCKLTNKEEQQFQKKIMLMKSEVTNFSKLFKYVGLKQRNKEEMLSLLKKSIKNSEKKKYHGELQILHELPNSQEQFNKILNSIPTYKKFIEVTQKVMENQNKKQISYEIHDKNSSDEEWRKMCIDRWSWVKQATIYEKQLTAQEVSQKAIDFVKQGILKAEDRLVNIINKKYKNQGIEYKVPKIEVPDTTWKQLFLRLDLEDFLIYIDMNADFTSFYEKLEVCKHSGVNTLLIPIIPINHLKSGYFYITSLLTKLNTLKYLQFSGLPQKNKINDKFSKAIKKGFNNFLSQNGRLEVLAFHNIFVSKDESDSLFEYLLHSDKLISLRFSNTNMLLYGNSIKLISKSLMQLKDLQELVFDECQLNEDKCKTIADVLIRTKKLKIFRIHNIQNVNNGLSSLIYNLSFFSPNLEMLDISRCFSNITETVVSLYKMLKITTSVEVVFAKNIDNLNSNLGELFWFSLGECRSLKVLDFSFSGSILNSANNLGKAIAFNAKKKGGLQYINLTNCINSIDEINNIYDGMCISEYDEQKIYGDQSKVAKMISSNYKKQYFNNLKAFQLNRCGNLNINFNLAYFNRLNQKEDPQLVKLFARSESLTNVQLASNNLNKSFAEALSIAIDPRRANFKSQIKVLNLSKNNLCKDGIKVLADVFIHNQIIQILDLSKNQMGVPGASVLAVSIKNNKSLKFLNLFNNKIGFDGAKSIAQNIVLYHPTLECLEVGHNRIRDKGTKQIVDAIVTNKNSVLKVLGLRFNYITNDGATYLHEKLTSHKTKIEEVFLRNNLIDDMTINNLEKINDGKKTMFALDLLEKLKYLDPRRLERSVWISPINNVNLQSLKQFFQVTHPCGIVLDARIKRARKYPNKSGQNIFGFIEFADRNSVNRALHLASKKLTIVNGMKFRVYKAGTGTFIFCKKTAKQKKLEQAKNELPQTPYDKPENNLNMKNRPIKKKKMPKKMNRR